MTNKLKATIVTIAPMALLFANNVSADQVENTYTVKAGDTLSQIAQDKFGSVEYADEIAYVNGVKDIDLIFEGEVLKLDGVKEAVVPSDYHVEGLEATPNTSVSQVTYAQSQAPVYQAPAQSYAGYSGGAVLSNGNTAGEVGSYAAAQMAARTGVSASTWEYIIARESNGQVNAYNPSGASGLFQTMPGWGSTATVEDQINAATAAYNAQGLSAWGY